MDGYSVKIKECTTELTARQKIMLKDTTDCLSLDQLTEGGQEVIIDFSYLVVLDVHNEKSDNKDYLKYVIVSQTGERYTTGSESFISSLRNIVDEMLDAGETEFEIKVYKRPSKNYTGKYFLTCSIV